MVVMKKVKQVSLIAENCSKFDLNEKDVADFYLGNIRQEAGRIGINSICEYCVCDTMFVAVDNMTEACAKGIAQNSVTSVVLHYDDETEKVIDMQWCNGFSGTDNCYQSFAYRDGTLFLLVDPNTFVEEYIAKYDDAKS